MDTVIRTHVKNQKRLTDLEVMINSWHEKGLNELGQLYILDDHSPVPWEVYKVTERYNINYVMAGGEADTKNGLAYSVVIPASYPVFCCVDDAVFGKGIKDRLIQLEYELPKIPDYGIVGTFACYEDPTRSSNRVPGTDLWRVPTEILYALVGHVYSKNFAEIIWNRWQDVLSGKAPLPKMCDDIWVKHLLVEFGYRAYNTMLDYTQHIGINNRTFSDDNRGSEYYSKVFVGE